MPPRALVERCARLKRLELRSMDYGAGRFLSLCALERRGDTLEELRLSYRYVIFYSTKKIEDPL